MGKFKIWSAGHVPSYLVALIVIVLSLAGACNGSDHSSKTTSVIGSVVFDCNACSEKILAFSGAHVAIKCQRGNDVSATGAGSVNDDGSFAIHLKVELGDLCLAEVVMPNNKLCSSAKTFVPSTLEMLSISTPLMCTDLKKTLDQKFSKIHPPIPKPNFGLSINFPKSHVKSGFLSVMRFLKPKNPQFFKTIPLPKFPPLPPISLPKFPPIPPIFKPKPFPNVFKPKPKPKPKPKGVPKPKPKPFPEPKFPPLPPIWKHKPFPKPKLPPLPPMWKPTPFPKPKFPPLPPIWKPKPFPKPKFPPLPPMWKPQPFPKLPPLPPIFKPKLYSQPMFLKPKPLFKSPPLPPILKPKPLPEPKFFQHLSPKPKLPPSPSTQP